VVLACELTSTVLLVVVDLREPVSERDVEPAEDKVEFDGTRGNLIPTTGNVSVPTVADVKDTGRGVVSNFGFGSGAPGGGATSINVDSTARDRDHLQ
jgi:hypothetical protein